MSNLNNLKQTIAYTSIHNWIFSVRDSGPVKYCQYPTCELQYPILNVGSPKMYLFGLIFPTQDYINLKGYLLKKNKHWNSTNKET